MVAHTCSRPRQPGYVAAPDPAVTRLEKSVEASIKQLGKKALDQVEFPFRPAFGTDGKTIKLFTNYLDMTINNDVLLHRYAIELKITKAKASAGPPDPHARPPEAPKGKKAKRLIQLLLKAEADFQKIAVATDYRSFLITNKRLDISDDGKDYDVVYYKEDEDGPGDDPKTFKIGIAPTQPLSSFQVSDLLAFISSGSVIQTPNSFGSKEEVIQCLNIVVGHNPKSRDNVTAVRTGSTGAFKYYPVQAPGITVFPLGAGLDAVRGFFMSVRPATSRLLINVQVKNAAFYKARPLVEIMQDFAASHREHFLKRLANFLKKISVNVTHIKRKNKKGENMLRIKMIYDLASRNDGNGDPNPPRMPKFGANANEVEFWFEKPPATSAAGKKAQSKSTTTGGYISVTKFFKEQYQITLRHPDLPVINVGTKVRPVYLPAEVCEVRPGQPCNTKLTSDQTRAMINFAVRRPNQNAESITDPSIQGGVGLLGFTGNNSSLNSFGIKVNPELKTVAGRILQPPQVKYRGQQMVPRFASWNLASVQFLNGTKLPQWTWIVFNSPRRPLDTSSGQFHDAVGEFGRMLTASGVECAPPVPGKSVMYGDPSDVTKTFTSLKNSKIKFPFVLVVVPDTATELYNEIKWQCDTQVGIQSLCVTANNFLKCNPQLNANLALKINLKLGGVNHAVGDLGLVAEGKTMVVGIDVTHPSPGAAETAPSVAAMVASTDKHMVQFPAAISVQTEARKEMVDHIGELFKTRLKLWQKKNQNLPENILVYRDGVSEGQYELMLRNELDQMRAACASVYGKKTPKFTVVVVGKRHHTRFYPQSVAEADRSANPPCGTIVDSTITEARNWDFFLQAHTALQGTAKPAHYFVIFDEIFRAKYGPAATSALEKLTHNMCYMFGRATKAVSMAPPAYYADLVCTRARCYLTNYYDPQPDYDKTTPSQSAKSGSGQTGATNDRTLQINRTKIHASLADTMFYI